MFLYLMIIFASGIIASVLNVLFAQNLTQMSGTMLVVFVWLAILISFAIDGIVAFLLRQIPANKIRHYSKFFKTRKFEKNLYNALKIRKWKDIIPELGGVLKYFDKKKLQENADSKYMLTFIKETCYGELMHIVAIFTAPLLLLILPHNIILTVLLPIMIVNIFLQIPPIMVQRFNRPKLFMAYTRLLKSERGNTQESAIQKATIQFDITNT